MKIVIDRMRCGATGNCVYWAPHTFEIGDAAVATVVNPGGDARELIEQAAANCPLMAIQIVSDGD